MTELTVAEVLKIPPFSQTLPTHALARAKAFVRELAVGAVSGYWGFDFHVAWDANGYEWSAWNGPESMIGEYVATKWGALMPNPELLVNLGLLSGGRQTHYDGLFSLVERAYNLIDETPPIPVFISYRNSDSSALALLLLARMKAVGLEPFLDITGLQGGDDWAKVLQTRVAESESCICLVGKTTLESGYVRQEISQAHAQGLRLIPLLHNGCTIEDLRTLAAQASDVGQTATILIQSQWITVREEKAREYNAAIVEVLNALGIAP